MRGINFSDFALCSDHKVRGANYSIEHLVAVGRSGEECGQLWDPSGIAIDVETNLIYITEGDFATARVSIFSDSGDFHSCYAHEEIICPWGIAIHCGKMYLTDIIRHSVSQYKLEEGIKFIGRVGCEGSEIEQFAHPNQLTVSTDAKVFVSDRDNNRVQILDSSLHYLGQLSHPSLELPCDVKVTTDAVYILCSSRSSGIHVFSHTGDKIRSLLFKTNGSQIVEPFFFCMGENENLFISDKGSSQIRVFSKVGELLYTIGEYGHEFGQLVHPYGIAITNYTNYLKCIVVSLNENYGLQIFSLL